MQILTLLPCDFGKIFWRSKSFCTHEQTCLRTRCFFALIQKQDVFLFFFGGYKMRVLAINAISLTERLPGIWSFCLDFTKRIFLPPRILKYKLKFVWIYLPFNSGVKKVFQSKENKLTSLKLWRISIWSAGLSYSKLPGC